MNGLLQKIAVVLGSRRFYWLVIGFFVFEALWVALSANYPMAFDEDFHFGVIKIYSGQWSPFLTGQPEGANKFGALAIDPSYLFHYLMSFPYRLLAAITDSQAAQVISLRLINVAIITTGLVLFRKVLLRAGTSPLVTNTATLLFALIPTVPLVAGQINYDNLFILALAGVCWFALLVTEDLRAGKINLSHIVWLAVLTLLACLVKYAFLPMLLAVFAYIVVLIGLKFRSRWREFGTQIQKSYNGIGKWLKVGLIVALVLSGGLFLQRYGVNMVKYGHPVPPCDAAIGVEACMEYGPWGRNYRYAAEKFNINPSPVAYTWTWLQGMHYRLFFMITGPPTHTNYPPAFLPSATAIVIVLCGTLSLIFYSRRVFAGQPFLVFLLLLAATYVAILWFQRYGEFLETGQPVAINGRYLIPLLLPMAAVFGRGLSVALQVWPMAKKWVVVAVILLFWQGGGVFSFILRSDASWYWPNRAVVKINEGAQNVLSPIMFIGPKHY